MPLSPLSPLTATSPLYPDGLIAPVWVRKHAELVPSVFVLFLRLYETPLQSEDFLSSESPADKSQRETTARGKEQEMDDLLVGQIGDRRRRLGERGIKLTVVLTASTEALGMFQACFVRLHWLTCWADSPHLDPRLSYLRRASALSSKASLFVLTPVPADQLPDFVQSLQEALYDSAMEYYANHTRRIRRKKARLPANQFGALLGGDRGRALGSQGWGVRYDWKAGWMAEVRGEIDVARRRVTQNVSSACFQLNCEQTLRGLLERVGENVCFHPNTAATDKAMGRSESPRGLRSYQSESSCINAYIILLTSLRYVNCFYTKEAAQKSWDRSSSISNGLVIFPEAGVSAKRHSNSGRGLRDSQSTLLRYALTALMPDVQVSDIWRAARSRSAKWPSISHFPYGNHRLPRSFRLTSSHRLHRSG